MPPDLKNVVDKVIQTNGYFAHSENILIAMLCDKRLHVRELGLKQIKEARSSNSSSSKNVRKFKVPVINFDAEDYVKMIEWKVNTFTEPPLTKSLTENQLKTIIEDAPEKNTIFAFPCHSQAVERCVKLVTQASATVCGPEARDGLIRSRISSLQILPKFDKKVDFLKTFK